MPPAVDAFVLRLVGEGRWTESSHGGGQVGSGRDFEGREIEIGVVVVLRMQVLCFASLDLHVHVA